MKRNIMLLAAFAMFAAGAKAVDPITLPVSDVCSAEGKSLLPPDGETGAAAILVIDAQPIATGGKPRSFLFFHDAPSSAATATVEYDGELADIRKAIDAQCPSHPKNFNGLVTSTNDRKRSGMRWLAGAGAPLRIFIVYSETQELQIQVTETARDRKIITDLKELANIAKSLTGHENAAELNIVMAIGRYNLREDRATVVVKLVAKGGKDFAAATITTGSIEHFSLSANLPLNSVKQLKFDSDTKTVSPKETPKELLLGLDYVQGGAR